MSFYSCKKKAVNKDIKRVNREQVDFFDLAGGNVCDQEAINQASINYLWWNYKGLSSQKFASLADLSAYYQNFKFKPGENKIEICSLDDKECSDLISVSVDSDEIVAYHPKKVKECDLSAYQDNHISKKFLIDRGTGFPQIGYGSHNSNRQGIRESISGYSGATDCQVLPLGTSGDNICDNEVISHAAINYLWSKSENSSEKRYSSLEELRAGYKDYVFKSGDQMIEICSSTGECSDLISVARLPARSYGSKLGNPDGCKLFTFPNDSDSPKYLLIHNNWNFVVGDGSDVSINTGGIQQTIGGSGAEMCRVAPIEASRASDDLPSGLVNIKLIEDRIEQFYQKVCQDDDNCPQGLRLMQLYDFSSLKNHPNTGISEILNPFAAPKDKFDYRCVLNSDQDIWSAYQEINSSDYQNHSSSCHRVVNENGQVKLNLSKPRSGSLFDKDKYQFEINNSVYSEYQDLFNLDYIRIETSQADKIANSRLKILSKRSAPFPSASLTGNYFMLNIENFTVSDFQNYNSNKSQKLRRGIIPAKSYLLVKEQFIQDWLKEVNSFFADTGRKSKPNPVSWCALPNNIEKCVKIDQEQIEQWQVERIYVESGIGYTTEKTFAPENSFSSTKIAKVTMDVLNKSGQGNQRLLLLNDCAYKPNRLRQYFRAFYDVDHSFYKELDTFFESRASLNERKRNNEIFRRIACNYNDSYIRYISNFHRVIDQNEQKKESLAAWVHAAETILAFEAVALLPELELPFFVSYAMKYVGALMGVSFVGQLAKDFSRLQNCKKDGKSNCYLEKNEIWIDAAFVAIPFSKNAVGKLVDYYGLFKNGFLENETEYFEQEKDFLKAEENKGACLSNGFGLACTVLTWEQTMIEYGKSILKYLKDNPEVSVIQNPKGYIDSLLEHANSEGGDIINTLFAKNSNSDVILPDSESHEATRLKYISVISAVQWSLADLRLDKNPFVNQEYIRGPGTLYGEEHLGKLYVHYFAFENQVNLDFSKNLNELVVDIKSLDQVFGRSWNPFVYNRTGSAWGILPLSSHLKQKNLNDVFLIGIDMRFTNNQKALPVLPAGDRHVHVGLFQFTEGGQTITYFKEEPWGLGTRKDGMQHFKEWGKHIFSGNAGQGPRETRTPKEKIESLFQDLKLEGYENQALEAKIPSLNSKKGAAYSFLDEMYNSFTTYTEDQELILKDVFKEHFDSIYVIGNEYTISAQKLDAYLAPGVIDP